MLFAGGFPRFQGGTGRFGQKMPFLLRSRESPLKKFSGAAAGTAPEVGSIKNPSAPFGGARGYFLTVLQTMTSDFLGTKPWSLPWTQRMVFLGVAKLL